MPSRVPLVEFCHNRLIPAAIGHVYLCQRNHTGLHFLCGGLQTEVAVVFGILIYERDSPFRVRQHGRYPALSDGDSMIDPAVEGLRILSVQAAAVYPFPVRVQQCLFVKKRDIICMLFQGGQQHRFSVLNVHAL